MIPTNKQPYPLPVGWQWTKIGLWANILRGVSYKKNDVHHAKQDGDCLILRGGNISEGNIDTTADNNVYVSKDFVAESQLVKQNDIILVASTGSKKVIGRAGISNQNYSDTSFGTFLLLVRPLTTLNPRYMDYFFQSEFYRNLIRNLAKGTNINNIRTEYVTEMPFPLPPLDEQQRIVALLDELFADLDEAKALAQAVVDGSKLRRAAILHKAFTGELSQLWRDEHGTTLGDWQWGTLNSVAECLDNLRSPVNAAERAKRPGKIPYYGATGQVGWIDDFLTDEQLVLLGEDGAPFLDMFKDKAYIIEGKAWVNNHAHILRSRFGNVGNKFLCHYLNVFDFSSYVNGTTRLKLTQAKMKTIPIPLPPPEEQEEIVRLLDDLLYREQRTKDHTLKTLDCVELMKKSILARAFRGELSINQIIRGRTTH